MDIAIRMQKIELGNERVIFKPIGVIKGNYDKENETFCDEYGYEYSFIEGTRMYDENYYCAPINIDDLKFKYEPDMLEDEILSEYLSEFINVCFIGYFDYVDCRIKLMEVDFDKIEEKLSEVGPNLDECIEFDLQNNRSFNFDMKSLVSLKQYENMDDLRKFIDDLIKAGDYVSTVSETQIENSDYKEEQEELIKQNETKKVLNKYESSKFNLKNMRDFVLSEIVAQDEAVNKITTTILKNIETTNPKMKSHILIAGPTGVGKTSIIERVCKYLDLPFCKVDATSYTQSGYIGRNIDEILSKLICAANNDIEKAKKGIIIIDEIDKKAGTRDDVATTAVQQNLLKLTGRGIVEVDANCMGTRSTIDFDTSDLTIVFTGAFEKLYKKKNEDNIKQIGFVKENKVKEDIKEITPELLIEYGIIPELIGRIKKVVTLKPLHQEDYVKILNYSNSSPIKVNKEFLELDKGIKMVVFTNSFKNEVSKKAEQINLGVRGLEKIVDDSVEQAIEDVLSGKKIKELKFTKATVLNPKKYYSN